MIELTFPSGVRRSRPFASLPAAIEWITTALDESQPYGPTGFLLNGTQHPLVGAGSWSIEPMTSTVWPEQITELTTAEQITELDRLMTEASGEVWGECDDMTAFAGAWLTDTHYSIVTAPVFGHFTADIMLSQYRVMAGIEDAARRVGLPEAKNRRRFGARVLRPIEDALEHLRVASLDAINHYITGSWMTADQRQLTQGDVTVILDDGTQPRSRQSPAGVPRLGIHKKGSR